MKTLLRKVLGEDPLSTLSAAAYAVLGAVVVAGAKTPEGVVLGVAALFLAMGTAVYHSTRSETGNRLDLATMNGFFAALATFAVGGPWFLMLPAAIAAAYVLEYVLNVHNYPVMGILVWIVFVALYAAGQYVLLGLSVASFGAGFALWLKDTDPLHALWHVLTAAGMGWALLGLM